MPEKLGQYLLRHQVISQEQLNEALQCQVIFGGRLGTNLVELGYLSLDDLSGHLSRRSGFPAASHEELEELPRETLSLLQRPVIAKLKVIPMRVEAKTLHCAVCDPTDLRAMDELAFSSGMRLKPYLLPELRMFYLLEKHYGIKRDIRYIRLGRTLSRGKYAGAMVGSGSAGQAPPAEPANTQELEAKGFRPLRQGEELTSEAEHAAMTMAAMANGAPALSVVPPPASPPSPAPASAAPPAPPSPPAPVASPQRPAKPAAAPAPVTAAPPATPAPVRASMPSPAPGPPAAPPAPPPPAAASADDEPIVRGTIESDTNLPVLEAGLLEPVDGAEPTAPDAPVAHPPPANDQDAAALRAHLTAASDREDVAGAALRLARSRFEAAALFIVKGPADPARAAEMLLLGWKGAGGALDRVSIENVMLPGNADSVLKTPAAGVIFHGPVPERGLNDRLLAALGRAAQRPAAAVVVPVAVKNRVVNLFYADNGANPIAPESAGWLQALARDVGQAYERIILSRKKSGAG